LIQETLKNIHTGRMVAGSTAAFMPLLGKRRDASLIIDLQESKSLLRHKIVPLFDKTR